jgi:hypothetical protein
MTPERLALEWFAGWLAAVALVLLISPIMNWLGGTGFTWHF